MSHQFFMDIANKKITKFTYRIVMIACYCIYVIRNHAVHDIYVFIIQPPDDTNVSNVRGRILTKA